MSGETYIELTKELNRFVGIAKSRCLETYDLVEFLRSDDTKVNIEQMYILCKC